MRLRAHGAGNLEPPLVAVGQVARRIVGRLISLVCSSQNLAFSIASFSASRKRFSPNRPPSVHCEARISALC